MLEHDPFRHRFFQCFTQIVIGVVIDQGTGVNAAFTTLLNDHLTEVAHETAALRFSQIVGHTAFGDFRDLRDRTRFVEVGKPDDGDILWDSRRVEKGA